MGDLRGAILGVFEAEEIDRASAAHVLDVLDRRGLDFSMAEFDDALAEMRSDGEIRVRNPSAPVNDRVIERRE